MTSTIVVQRRQEVLVLTDGVGYAADGSRREVAKAAMLPRAPGLLACRGVTYLGAAVAMDCQHLDFDDVVNAAGELISIYSERLSQIPELKKRLGQEEFTLAGFSKKRQAMAVFLCVTDDRYADRGIRPFVFQEQRDPITIAPWDPEQQHMAAFSCPDPEEFDPAVDGLKIMETQRDCPEWRETIGCHIMAYAVRRDGVSAKVIHRWS